MYKNMDTAEVRAMTKLPSTVGSMTEADRVRRQFEASRDAISDERRILDHLCEHIKPEEDNDEAEILKKGAMGAAVDIQNREELSAAENLPHLNKLTSNSCKIAPFTSTQQPFASFFQR
ncbi:hypothetical protein BGZ97_001685, partial [Linnemannia gamsii]